MPRSPHRGPLPCFLMALCAVSLAVAGDANPPAPWDAAAGNPAGAWALMQVWPDKVEQGANYRPLAWGGGRWLAASDGRGGIPAALVADAAVRLQSAGVWGRDNPGARLAALVFTASATGVYTLHGTVAMRRGEGDAANHVALILLPADGRGRQLRTWRFRRPDPGPSPIDEVVFVEAGSRLVWVPRLADNNSAAVTIAGLSIGFTPATAPPEGFRDGMRPSLPPPPATGEQSPPVVIEGEQVEFPADANVVNVRSPPYNAKGDGVSDDTAALQQALSESGLVYLPNGVYLISDQLRFTKGARVPSRTTMYGQSVAGTIIKLRDRTPDFTDPKTPFAMLRTSNFPPQAFQIHVRNLTFHGGSGNPGAIGVQFYANNQGSIEDVRVRSGDGAGVIGLDLGYDNDQGPMLARNIRVEGFDIGVRCARQTTITTLEGISVEGQRQVGFLNDMHCVAMRRFTSRNRVPALQAMDSAAYTCVVDGRIEGLDGDGPGIVNQGGMFLRDVTVGGYKSALLNQAAKDGQDVASLPREWTSHPAMTLWPDSARRSLGLPVQETPTMAWGPLDTWVSVRSFPSTVVDTGTTYKGKKVTYEDSTAAVRQAMAAGKSTVYFPKGAYIVDGEIRVPAHVRRIYGLGSLFDRDRGRAVFVIEDGTEPLRIERWDWMYSHVIVRHQGKRPIALVNVSGGHYEAGTGAGDVFFDDVTMGGVMFRQGQHVWMRQFNPEYGDKPKIINDGADLWILGIKTEGYSSMLLTRNGGRTEILGGMAYANEGRDPEALFVNLAPSQFSCSLAEWVLRSQRFEEIVVERRPEGMRILRSDQVPARGDKPDGKPLGGYGTSFCLPLFASWKDGT